MRPVDNERNFIQRTAYRAIILIEPTIVTREVFNSHLEDRMAAINFFCRCHLDVAGYLEI